MKNSGNKLIFVPFRCYVYRVEISE